MRLTELDHLMARRTLARQQFNQRKRQARQQGKTLVTQLESEKVLREISLALTKVRRLFTRLDALEYMENNVINGRPQDKTAGRNRGSLRYGTE